MREYYILLKNKGFRDIYGKWRYSGKFIRKNNKIWWTIDNKIYGLKTIKYKIIKYDSKIHWFIDKIFINSKKLSTLK